LAILGFVAGLELKREFVAGDLRGPRRSAKLGDLTATDFARRVFRP
jgi:Na+/H+ antiporter NhaA